MKEKRIFKPNCIKFSHAMNHS